MAEFTKEEQIQAIYDLKVGYTLGHADIAMLKAMASQLLAGLEQEPVAWRWRWSDDAEGCWRYTEESRETRGSVTAQPLYTAPQLPQPAVVPSNELLSAMEEVLRISDRDHEAWHRARKGIADFRAAMLQGAEPAAAIKPAIFIDGNISPDDADKLADAISKLNSEHREPQQMIAEPVQGWIPCSERMPPCFTGVIVAAPWPSAPDGYAMKWATNCPWHPDADENGWLIPGASWNPTHWMHLPAAPQQEVKSALEMGMTRYGDAMQELAKKEVG